MARAPKAENYALEFDEMGAISMPAMGEVYASGLAEDLGEREAWTQAGGAQSEKSLALKAKMDSDPLFQSRVETLREVRKEQLADPLFGEAIAMINLAYRDARSRRHREDTLEMVKLRLRASESCATHRLNLKRLELQANGPEKPSMGPETPAPKGKVGAPALDPPKNASNRPAIRSELMKMAPKKATVPEPSDDDVTLQ
jgi:hypothetical protein